MWLLDRFGLVGQGDRHDGPHRGADQSAGGATRTRFRDRAARRVAARSIASSCAACPSSSDEAQTAVRRITGELAGIAEATMARPPRCFATPDVRCVRRPDGAKPGCTRRLTT